MTMTYPSDAQNVIDKYANDFPVNLVRIASDEGVNLNPIYMFKDSGRIYKSDDTYTIEFNIVHPVTRQRFTIAHEFGHYFMDRDKIDQLGLKDNAIYRSGLPTSEEVRANCFAADLLMPMHLIEQIIDNATANKEKITPAIIAEKFNVSQQAIRIRLGIV